MQLDVPSVCAQCGGGRLVGQAVHEPEVGWRYFLACTDCEAKLELGQESVQPFAQPLTETLAAKATSEGHDVNGPPAPLAGDTGAPKTQARTCKHSGCTTILSFYNKTTACWAHTGPSFK
jgi:hypothetical protein